MAKLKLTEQQQAAVENRGGSLLVSAAAGSGKTKVLVERLFRYVTEGSHILWVPGHRISEYYKISETTETILEIQICKGERHG